MGRPRLGPPSGRVIVPLPWPLLGQLQVKLLQLPRLVAYVVGRLVLNATIHAFNGNCLCDHRLNVLAVLVRGVKERYDFMQGRILESEGMFRHILGQRKETSLGVV